MTEIYYPEAWFKVEYTITEHDIQFNGYEIISIDMAGQNHEVEKDACLNGFIWLGSRECMEFEYNAHYCGSHQAESFSKVIKEIYAFRNKVESERS